MRKPKLRAVLGPKGKGQFIMYDPVNLNKLREFQRNKRVLAPPTDKEYFQSTYNPNASESERINSIISDFKNMFKIDLRVQEKDRASHLLSKEDLFADLMLNMQFALMSSFGKDKEAREIHRRLSTLGAKYNKLSYEINFVSDAKSIDFFLKDLKLNSNVLELGSGIGILANYASSTYPSVKIHAYDMIPKQISDANLLKKQANTQGVSFTEMEITPNNLPAGKFDSIWISKNDFGKKNCIKILSNLRSSLADDGNIKLTWVVESKDVALENAKAIKNGLAQAGFKVKCIIMNKSHLKRVDATEIMFEIVKA